MKKSLERAYLGQFQSLLADFPKGQIESTEAPDFLVHLKGSILGLELTELHRSTGSKTSEQATLAMRTRLMARAQEIYTQKGFPPVRVSVFMAPVPIRKCEVESLAEVLAEIAIYNLPDENSRREEAFEWTNRPRFPDTFQLVWVQRLDAITESHFVCPSTSWVAPLAPADIEPALLSKEQQYVAYRKRCDVVWLLVIVDLESISTWFQFESTKLDYGFPTSFDRVFVLSHFSGTLYELNLQNRGA